MTKILRGQSINSVQKKRFSALGGYVFSALGLNGSDVKSIEDMVSLVNDVFEAGITYEPSFGAMIDQMWGYVSGLTKSQRKKLKNKNLHKIKYPMKGALGAKQKARADYVRYHSAKSALNRKERDAVVLARTVRKNFVGGGKPSAATKDQFYKSWEWRTIRMEVLTQHGRACQCCGAEPGMKTAAGEPVRICVDHIKPLSKFWHLRLDRSNLQVLCDECNQGKGAWDQTDFRKPEAPDEWVIEDAEISNAILHQLTDPTTGRLQ